LEEIEREKAKERMSLGGKGGINQEGQDDRPNLESKQSRDAVGEKIDMSGRQYDRAKYISENAPDEIIDELDKGKRTISGTYEELRAKEKPKTSRKDNIKYDKEKTDKYFSKSDLEIMERNKQFSTMPPEEKVVELQRQLKEERIRATQAESELSTLKDLHHNAVYHKDGIINNLQARLEKAETLLDEARARIKELETT
jgi:ParB family chromosome partitioning protein